jgi:O-acetyl-ADP-ribose deacetylase (regulator of RNase III)
MNNKGYIHGFELDRAHSLHLYKGSLVEVNADALVSSDDNYLSAGGGVSGALAKAAGFDVRREREKIAEKSRPALGDVVRTSAGALPCRYLYHAITIDFDHNSFMDESHLRQLIKNLIDQAAADGIRSIGMPVLGTGAALFDLSLAAEIIINELMIRVVATPITRVVIALIGDESEKLFYERLVRSQSGRLATLALRQRTTTQNFILPNPASLRDTFSNGSFDPETVEQFPNLVDEDKLSRTNPDRPRLIDGLATVILQHVEEEDVEKEILSSSACREFRGTIKQRLMEFLYLSENNLRIALGPALFKNKDLRRIAEELGDDTELTKDQEQLVTTILRALCFNMLSPPEGLTEYISRTEKLQTNLRSHDCDKHIVDSIALEAGKIVEKFLKDLLRMYGYVLWGANFEKELVRNQVIPERVDDDSIARLTIGQARQALEQLRSIVKRNSILQAKLRLLRRPMIEFLPDDPEDKAGKDNDYDKILQEAIDLRNASAHAGRVPPKPEEVASKLENLCRFLCACKQSGVYPDVLRYEGTFENRNGERFVYFLDESGGGRKVRTDEKIDARRHYYCISSNNPMHLHPMLIPKL